MEGGVKEFSTPEAFLPFVMMIGNRPSLAPGEWKAGRYAGLKKADPIHVPSYRHLLPPLKENSR